MYFIRTWSEFRGFITQIQTLKNLLSSQIQIIRLKRLLVVCFPMVIALGMLGFVKIWVVSMNKCEKFTIEELAECKDFSSLNVLILERRGEWLAPPTFPYHSEDEFSKRMPKKGLITKAVRALSLTKLLIGLTMSYGILVPVLVLSPLRRPSYAMWVEFLLLNAMRKASQFARIT